MKHSIPALVSAALLLCSLPLVNAASRPKTEFPAVDARTTLRQIGELAGDISNHSDRLNMIGKDPAYEGQSYIGDLTAIKDDINRIHSAVQALDDERDSLAAWEKQAVDDVVPLINSAAREETGALNAFNTSRDHLWTTPFQSSMADIYRDSREAERTISGLLKAATD